MLNQALLLRLKQATGLDLSHAAVSRAMQQRMKDCANSDRAAYVQQALHSSAELSALIDQVVVPETWFFRDAEAFTMAVAFVQQALERTPARTRPLRLLSIPCATGEEPCSLAMALLDAGVSPQAFTIEAVDVSQQVLDRARRGLYTRNAFRTADLSFRDRHFSQAPDGYTLSAAVRAQVQMSCGNLLTLDTPAAGQAFDLIFCRNLLIYFDAPTQRLAIHKLLSLLQDDGLLFVGYAEAATFCQHGFAMAPFPKAFALKKNRAKEAKETKEAALPRSARAANAASTALKPRTLRAPVLSTQAATTASRPATNARTLRPAPVHAELPDALLRQAGVLADAGKPDEACAQYLAHLKMAPECVEAYFMLGLLSEHTGANAAAESYLRRAIYLDPGHYEALCHLALLTDRSGHAHEAVVFRQRAARAFERRPTPSTPANP